MGTTELCDNWEWEDGSPTGFMLQLGTWRTYDYDIGAVLPICTGVALNASYSNKCIAIDLQSADPRKSVALIDMDLSSRPAGASAFERLSGQIIATETGAGTGQFFLRKANTNYAAPMLARNSKSPREVVWGDEKTAPTDLNRFWVPMSVPLGDGAAQKKVVTTVQVAQTTPRCDISAAPLNGVPTTAYAAWSVSSGKGLSCLIDIDGKRQGTTVDCNSQKTYSAQAAGDHKITLYVGGANGTGKCSANFRILSECELAVMADNEWCVANGRNCSSAYTTAMTACKAGYSTIYRSSGSLGHVESHVYASVDSNEGSYRFAAQPQSGGWPLYRCGFQPDFLSKFSTCEGKSKISLAGYSYPSIGSTAVMRCRVNGTNDHFISRDTNCENQINEGIIGYTR